MTKFVLLILIIFPYSLFAQSSNISTSDAINQIQKTLIFSDNNSAKKAAKESTIAITRDLKEAKKPKINILVNDNNSSKKEQNLERKQKLIYNASIAGQYEVAIELSKQILASDPKNSYAKFILASCYHKLGQNAQAKKIYYELLKNQDYDEQTRDEIISNLIEVLVEESPDEAIYFLSKLSYQSPKSAYILAGTAMAYEKIQRHEEAILLLQKAINIDPDETRYKFNLAIIFDKKGDYQNAIKYYRDVLDAYKKGTFNDSSMPVNQVAERIKFIKDNY